MPASGDETGRNSPENSLERKRSHNGASEEDDYRGLCECWNEINCFCCDRGSRRRIIRVNDFSAGTVHFLMGCCLPSRNWRSDSVLSGLNGHGQGWWSFPWLGRKTSQFPCWYWQMGRRHHARQVFMKGVPLFLTKTKFSRPYQRDTVSPLSFQDDYARSPRLNRTAPFLLAVTGMAHGSAATAWPSLLQWT